MRLFKRFLCVIAALMLVVAFVYGGFLMAFGWMERDELQQARATLTAVSVHVTDIHPSASNPFWYEVTLDVENAPQSGVKPDAPNGLRGATCAATINRNLQVGSQLTMYYDPSQPDTRMVDFGTATWFFTAGGILCGIPLLVCVGFLFIRRLRRRQKHPIVELAPPHTP